MTMDTIVGVPNEELVAMDNVLLDRARRLTLLPAGAFGVFHPNALRAWCVTRARYGLVTSELIDWLKVKIAGRSALEIGAGMGDLGYHLGIQMTDSYQQVTDTDTMAFCKHFKQTPTSPPQSVVKYDAQTAVILFKPQVVIGSWITQRWLPGEKNGNMHGPREEVIIKNCDCYIVIGNDNIHGDKRILNMPHKTYQFPWLLSRAKDQSKNCIYVWEK